MKQIVEFSIEIDNVFYHTVCEVSYHDDNNWGADADNKRGVFKRIIDDVKVMEAWVNHDGIVCQAQITKRIENAICEAAGDHL